MKLTNEERAKFTQWCLDEAESNDQMVKIASGKLDSALAERLGERFNAESAAYRFIARRLNPETMEVTRD